MPYFCPASRTGLKIRLGIGIPFILIIFATAAYLAFRRSKHKRQHAVKSRKYSTQLGSQAESFQLDPQGPYQDYTRGAENVPLSIQKGQGDGRVAPSYAGELETRTL